MARAAGPVDGGGGGADDPGRPDEGVRHGAPVAGDRRRAGLPVVDFGNVLRVPAARSRRWSAAELHARPHLRCQRDPASRAEAGPGPTPCDPATQIDRPDVPPDVPDRTPTSQLDLFDPPRRELTVALPITSPDRNPTSADTCQPFGRGLPGRPGQRPAEGPGGVPGVLTITKLRGAEYLIASVADGVEDYYMGAGEAPGVWQGRWAEELGLDGRRRAPTTSGPWSKAATRDGADLLAGHREREVRAIDVTLSVPKSVSLLWAFGTPETSAEVSIAVVGRRPTTALEFLEDHAAVARQQQGGVRRQVGDRRVRGGDVHAPHQPGR